MSDNTDLETKDSTSEAGKRDSGSSKSIDYEAKYRGLSKKYSNLEKEKEALEAKYDSALEDKEAAEAKVRATAKDGSKSLNDEIAARKTAEERVATLEASLAKIEADKTIRVAIKDKFKDKAEALTEMLEAGDLKTPADFTKPEEWDAYLTRMAAKIVVTSTPETPDAEEEGEVDTNAEVINQQWSNTARRDLLAGTTPHVNLSKTHAQVRQLSQIEDDMWNLSDREPDYNKKYIALEREWNQAKVAQR